MKRFNLSEWAITHQPLVLFMIILLGAAGIYSYLNLGRAEDPSFTIKVMVVNVAWPGATATEMQAQVADKIEKKLQELPLSRSRRELFAARRLVHPRHAHRPHAARQGQGAVVPGAQEGRRHQGRPAAGIIGPNFNDEYGDVYSALYMLTADGPDARRAQDARRGHPPAPAARPRRQQGRHHRRAAAEDLHRVQPRQARDARPDAAADLRERGQAERRDLRRLGRHLGRPHQSARDRRVLRRRGDRRRAGAGRTGRCFGSATSRRSGAATRIRRPSSCARAASPRSASACPCRTAPTSSRSART